MAPSPSSQLHPFGPSSRAFLFPSCVSPILVLFVCPPVGLASTFSISLARCSLSLSLPPRNRDPIYGCSAVRTGFGSRTRESSPRAPARPLSLLESMLPPINALSLSLLCLALRAFVRFQRRFTRRGRFDRSVDVFELVTNRRASFLSSVPSSKTARETVESPIGRGVSISVRRLSRYTDRCNIR